MTPHHTVKFRTRLIAGGWMTLLSAVSVGTAADPGAAVASSPPLGCEPIACAAADIGVPATTLASEIAAEAQRTGTLGVQVAIDQLDAAMATGLAAIPPAPEGTLAASQRSVIARHHAVRDALLTQAVTALRAALGG